MTEDNKYPLEPPYDDDLDFYQEATVRINPQGQAKKAKFCPICNYPIHIRMVSMLCRHYFCYECYQKNTYACGFCGGLNSKIIRVGDNQPLISCDLYCSKAYQNEEQLMEHRKSHAMLKKND